MPLCLSVPLSIPVGDGKCAQIVNQLCHTDRTIKSALNVRQIILFAQCQATKNCIFSYCERQIQNVWYHSLKRGHKHRQSGWLGNLYTCQSEISALQQKGLSLPLPCCSVKCGCACEPLQLHCAWSAFKGGCRLREKVLETFCHLWLSLWDIIVNVNIAKFTVKTSLT